MFAQAGKTYVLNTRLGQSTFTWLYVIDSDGSTVLETCQYCKADETDPSSTITYTADASKTVFIKVHVRCHLYIAGLLRLLSSHAIGAGRGVSWPRLYPQC